MGDRAGSRPGGLPEDLLHRGLPPGSRRYLAVLFAGSAARGTLGALYAFEAELRRIVASDSHEAAHARLKWWRDEVDRLAAGRASHPITQALPVSRGRQAVDTSLLHELLAAADLDLAGFTYRDWTQLEGYCYRAGGSLQTLIAGALAGDRPLSALEREFARRLGSGITQARMLRDLPQDLARGRVYAPLDVLADHGVDAAALVRSEPRSAPRDFLDAWRQRVRDELDSLDRLLESPSERSDQRHGLVLAALYSRMLGAPLDAADRSRRRVDLEPIGRLWTAWRTALRCG